MPIPACLRDRRTSRWEPARSYSPNAFPSSVSGELGRRSCGRGMSPLLERASALLRKNVLLKPWRAVVPDSRLPRHSGHDGRPFPLERPLPLPAVRGDANPPGLPRSSRVRRAAFRQGLRRSLRSAGCGHAAQGVRMRRRRPLVPRRFSERRLITPTACCAWPATRGSSKPDCKTVEISCIGPDLLIFAENTRLLSGQDHSRYRPHPRKRLLIWSTGRGAVW